MPLCVEALAAFVKGESGGIFPFKGGDVRVVLWL